MKHEDYPVDATVDLTTPEDARVAHTWVMGDFKPTNVPLSAAEIERRMQLSNLDRDVWDPRTLANIGELEPIPESESNQNMQKQ
jgi:hypothetical protein